jgi:hypothetical protein
MTAIPDFHRVSPVVVPLKNAELMNDAAPSTSKTI